MMLKSPLLLFGIDCCTHYAIFLMINFILCFKRNFHLSSAIVRMFHSFYICNNTFQLTHCAIENIKTLLFQALMVNQKEPYNIHWPIRRGCFNIHSDRGGTVSAVLQDLEDILATAMNTCLNISRSDIKVSVVSNYLLFHI